MKSLCRGRTGSFRPVRQVAAALVALVAVLAASPLAGYVSSRTDKDEASHTAAPAAHDVAVLDKAVAPTRPAVVVAPAQLWVDSRMLDVSWHPIDLIPAAALVAYQRAAVVIAGADESCGLDWELLAAIGRVESNHGQYGGNRLDASGVARPGVYGPRLTGQHHTSRILDTDGGELDHDTRFDRAVGPMQFIPSTWAMVVVDGDGDGVRNPQDVDDAALATAVYLCSGTDDLSTSRGERAAVHRYNHSWSYVDLVLAVKQAYETWAASAPGPPDLVATAVSPLEPVEVPGAALNEVSGLTLWPQIWSTTHPVYSPPATETADSTQSGTASGPNASPTLGSGTDPGADVGPEPADPIDAVPIDPVPIDPVPIDPVPTEPVPIDPVPTDPVLTEPVPPDPAAVLQETLVAARDECVAGGVDGGSVAVALCMSGLLVVVIDEDGTIIAATRAEDGAVQDPGQEAAELDALIAWLDSPEP
jgi:membrane-bound lytic murein transglycosylase B